MENKVCTQCNLDCKTKVRSEEELKPLLVRLNRIGGQVNGLKRMLEENAYCTDVLIQSSAIIAALNGFNKEILSEHIRTCVADHIKQGDDSVVTELVDTLQKMMK